MTSEGRLFLIDIVLAVVKEQIAFTDFNQENGPASLIDDAKLDQKNNTLVFRTRGN
jgi:hypothetical protein